MLRQKVIHLPMIKTKNDMKNTETVDNQDIRCTGNKINYAAYKRLGNIVYQLEMLSLKSGIPVDELIKKITEATK